MICPHPMSIPRPNGKGSTDRITIPCGKCAACLASRREEWTSRLLEEQKAHLSSLFLTLTYSNENIHLNQHGIPSVDKRDVQLFLKKIRKKLPYKVRYYCVGEYGTRTRRPHYHIILFGCLPADAHILTGCWNYGHIGIGSVNIRSIKYTAKYHVNRTDYPKGATPSFTLMSNRPGIGYNYVKRMAKFHEGNLDHAYLPDFEKKRKLPRYFKLKLYSEAEREELSKMFTDETYSLFTVEEYNRKNPNGNYFKHMLDRISNYESKFKEKSNYNEKI